MNRLTRCNGEESSTSIHNTSGIGEHGDLLITVCHGLVDPDIPARRSGRREWTVGLSLALTPPETTRYDAHVVDRTVEFSLVDSSKCELTVGI